MAKRYQCGTGGWARTIACSRAAAGPSRRPNARTNPSNVRNCAPGVQRPGGYQIVPPTMTPPRLATSTAPKASASVRITVPKKRPARARRVLASGNIQTNGGSFSNARPKTAANGLTSAPVAGPTPTSSLVMPMMVNRPPPEAPPVARVLMQLTKILTTSVGHRKRSCLPVTRRHRLSHSGRRTGQRGLGPHAAHDLKNRVGDQAGFALVNVVAGLTGDDVPAVG
jgi:hypothetical protein